ncbi:hypothetical protein NQ317_010202, partial [Molorchus minor]
MSAGVSDQRMKGQGNQVSNGPKEQLGAGEGATGSEEFEPWRSQQQNSAAHTAYGASVPISSATDMYNMSTAVIVEKDDADTREEYQRANRKLKQKVLKKKNMAWIRKCNFIDQYLGGTRSYEAWRTIKSIRATTKPGTNLSSKSNSDWATTGAGGTYPYQAYGVGDGTWSNGTDPMTFLSGYPHDSYSMDDERMFGPSTTFSTPTAFAGQPSSFNYFHSKRRLQHLGKSTRGQRKYDDYYRDHQNMYTQAMPESALKSVEQAMQNLARKTATTLAKPRSEKKRAWYAPRSHRSGKHNMDIGTWDTNKSTPPQLPIVNNTPKSVVASAIAVRPAWNGPPTTRQAPPLPKASPSILCRLIRHKVRWIYVKDVPNVQLRHIQLENNDNKPVTNSRDTQEVPHARGLQRKKIAAKQPVIKDSGNHDGGSGRDHRERGDHRGGGGRNHDRDGDRDNHRPGGHRNNDHH